MALDHVRGVTKWPLSLRSVVFIVPVESLTHKVHAVKMMLEFEEDGETATILFAAFNVARVETVFGAEVFRNNVVAGCLELAERFFKFLVRR